MASDSALAAPSSAAVYIPGPMDTLLAEMMAAGASDLFLAEGRSPTWRVDGEVTVTLHPPTTAEDLGRFMASVLRPSQREAFERTGDLDVGRTIPELGRFRMHFHVQRGMVGVVVRAVPSGQLSFERLGLPEVLKTFADTPRGLVLVTGGTGSGKSTTLAAMVHHINSTYSKHVVTLEDPIEFVHEDLLSLVTQREIGSDTRDFAVGLRHVVRESPDVIVVGEMRDPETMAVALSAALTGHLVLSSVHTVDAAQTLQRILGYFPEHQREQVCMDLSMCLVGIAAQRLLPRADGEGRVVAVEVLTATPAMRRLIRERRVEEVPDLMAGAGGGAGGMETFNRALLRLYHEGSITFETGAAYAQNADEFRMNAQGMERGAVLSVEHDLGGDRAPVDMQGLLAAALRGGASDLHLIAGRPPLLRVGGMLRPIEGTEPLTAPVARRLVLSLLSHAQRERFDLEREIDFALTVTGGSRFRVNAHYQRGTAAASIRLIPGVIPEIESLGLPRGVRELANREQGLVLVTGPTGSGKSTTLAALVDVINRSRACHIITLEDPIEFVHENRVATVEQREIGADTKSFAAALKNILRQDPDVILVGELRDPETIAAALTAAETGHLVFGTLHANDAPQTVDRIIDVFPPHQQPQIRVQLASELLAVVAQRLLPRASGEGRVGVFEVMVATTAVRTQIREGKGHLLLQTLETSRRDGMITFERSLADLVQTRQVTMEEALRLARSRGSLEAQLKADAGFGVTRG
ncbi:type IV pilus twitching motility protein PilT [Chondromyces apiculatus]|uniref:Twitching motility protein PilT n=1 Tax=Chondromyces apiculatus DSM 436 TaxID=1192034 RepID=A0A017TH10_9BACT|nr:PilT/PilU family type 4a pilus ATPase [Chondromyces apiculatus]EYF08533.1 Twitching motility protein PilT [Chondromyces apiculatus DSM 436]